MNDTQKKIKKTKIDSVTLHEKLDELDRLLLSLNAFGTLNTRDYQIISNYIKGSFYTLEMYCRFLNSEIYKYDITSKICQELHENFTYNN
jgi:hypothetical protein